MDAVGQQHSPWILEGLATLYEDYRFLEDGSIVYPPTDRHAFVQRLAGTGRLRSWKALLSMTERELQADSLRTYPQLRSMFRFFAEQEPIEVWYQRYVNGFDEDPTGVQALGARFECPIDVLEQRWRRWLDGGGGSG